MNDLRRIQFRAAMASRVPLPFGIRSAGCYDLGPNGYGDKSKAVKHFVELFWCAAGWGTFKDLGRSVRLGPEEIFVYPTDRRHEIQAGDKGFKYYWFTLDGPLAGAMVTAFGLVEPWPRRVGPPPAKLFERLIEQLTDVNLAGERAAAVTGFALLAAAAAFGPRRASRPGVGALIESSRARLVERVADPELGIETLADALGIHRSLLSRQFRESVGLSPKKYLTSLRIHRAMSLLKETDLPIRDIARRTGFADANYFSRAFRRSTGLSPERFRRD